MSELRADNVGFSAGEQVYIHYGNYSAREKLLTYAEPPSRMGSREQSVPIDIEIVYDIFAAPTSSSLLKALAPSFNRSTAYTTSGYSNKVSYRDPSSA